MSIYNDVLAPIPRETLSAICETRKPIAESQNSSNCYSDKDSSVSTEKNIPALVYCRSKGAEIDIVSDYGVNYGNPPQQNDQNYTTGYVTNMHEQEVTRLISNKIKSN